MEVRLGPEMNRTVVVELDTSGTIDVAAERRRLEKELAGAQKELASTAAKLANADFLAKAPDAVIAKIRDRQRVAQQETERITTRLAALQ
ncbi:valyl-tRNA synthase valS [Mycobacterium tuberculosis]|nr:valyl-tRNA synthase valS [Mycobacterium tuberculosis]